MYIHKSKSYYHFFFKPIKILYIVGHVDVIKFEIEENEATVHCALTPNTQRTSTNLP